VLSTDVTANTTISTSTNATGTFLDYSGVTFADDVEIHINGVLMRGGATAGANYDVYPAGTASNGDFACEFDLIDTDVIQMLIGGGGAGTDNWIDLVDTYPTSYTGNADKFVRVNSAQDGLEFAFPPVAAPWLEDVFVPTLGQVTFILSQIPTDPTALSLHANGIEALETVDYTLSGLTLTWLNTEFSFDTTDGVVIQYK
jgi:hypothetical protein